MIRREFIWKLVFCTHLKVFLKQRMSKMFAHVVLSNNSFLCESAQCSKGGHFPIIIYISLIAINRICDISRLM